MAPNLAQWMSVFKTLVLWCLQRQLNAERTPSTVHLLLDIVSHVRAFAHTHKTAETSSGLWRMRHEDWRPRGPTGMSDCQEEADEKNMQLVQLKRQSVLQAFINDGLIWGLWFLLTADTLTNQQPSLLFSLRIIPILLHCKFDATKWKSEWRSPQLASASPICWESSWRIPCRCFSL